MLKCCLILALLILSKDKQDAPQGIFRKVMAQVKNGVMNFGNVINNKIEINIENLKPEDQLKLYRGIDEHKKNYYELMDDLVDDAYRCFQTKDRHKTIRILVVIINLSVKIPEYPILIKLMRIITQIFIYFRDWDSSIFCLEKLRDVCIMYKDYSTVMVVYKQAGIIYQHLKDYTRAIICFKKMLQMSWVTNSYEGEISAFDQLALQYFYLGDLDKAKYHKRSINGIREKEDSYARVTAMEKFSKEIEEIEKEIGFNVKGMDQIIDNVTKTIIKVMNELPDYEKVKDDLKDAER
jgi:tetratricopeptide (TPR) repeat protein